MGSPITFSGFNNIDFNLILNSVMQQASAPLKALETRQSDFKARLSGFDKFRSEVVALQQTVNDLSTATAADTVSSSTTDSSAVSVSTGTDAQAGHYDIVVNELARAQVTAAATTVADAETTLVATGGSLTIGGVTVTVSSDMTLNDLADAINGTADIPAVASVVRASAGAYRLVLTGRETGQDAAFTITNALAGSSIAFTDTDGDGTSGDSAADNAIVASDASILVNNVAATSATNVFAAAIPGLTLTVFKKDPAETIGVDVTPDGASLKAKLESFVKAYNSLTKFASDQRTSAAGGNNGTLNRDPILRQLGQQLRSVLSSAHGSGDLDRLSQAGVEFTITGSLKLNTKTFDAAFESDPASLQSLVTGETSVFASLDSLLNAYTDSGGLIAANRTQISDQIRSLDSQLLDMQGRLAVQRAALQKEFLAAEVAMSRLQSQSGSLSGLGG